MNLSDIAQEHEAKKKRAAAKEAEKAEKLASIRQRPEAEGDYYDGPDGIQRMKDEIRLLDLARYDLNEEGTESGEAVCFHNCPFHERKDCFRVYPKTNSCACFSDSNPNDRKGGDVLDYIQLRGHLTNAEAVEELRQITGHPQQSKGADRGTLDKGTSELMETYDRGGRKLYRSTPGNYQKVFTHDKRLRGRARYNEFTRKYMLDCPVPWREDGRSAGFVPYDEDIDTQGARVFMEENYPNMTNGNEIESAIKHIAKTEGRYNPLQDELNALEWDGTERAETLFIKWLGAEDTPYTRAATRVMLNGAVMRAFNPGVKFDYMVILTGAQGIGKSALLQALALNPSWFTDNLTNFSLNKVNGELLNGKWIVEVAELTAMKRSAATDGDIKQFVSAQSDRYRAAFERKAEDQLRMCVFFGTSNTSGYLRDATGNRRFLPIDCKKPEGGAVDIPAMKEYCIQVWAEVMNDYKQSAGDLSLVLPSSVLGQLKAIHESHREEDPLEGMVSEFLDAKAAKAPLSARVNVRMFIDEVLTNDADKVGRQGSQLSGRVRELYDAAEGWERMTGKQRVGSYYPAICWEYMGGEA